MKILITLLLTFVGTNSFAQQRMERADSCITRLNSVKFTNTKDGKLRIAKVRVPDMIRRIKYCSLTYKYPESYRDRSFELTAPGYLGELSYGFGDNDFYYSFNDSNDADSLTTSIVVYYDFDGSYKRFFLDQVDTKKQDAEIKYFGKRKMYLFKNWQKFFCGKLFLSRNTMVFYCTANEDKEKELQQAILTFKWE